MPAGEYTGEVVDAIAAIRKAIRPYDTEGVHHVEYLTGVSGGDTFMDDDDWDRLERAGWVIDWAAHYANSPTVYFDEATALYRFHNSNLAAKKAYLPNATLNEALQSFDSNTTADYTDTGCDCCGPPHHFTEYDKDGGEIAEYLHF